MNLDIFRTCFSNGSSFDEAMKQAGVKTPARLALALAKYWRTLEREKELNDAIACATVHYERLRQMESDDV